MARNLGTLREAITCAKPLLKEIDEGRDDGNGQQGSGNRASQLMHHQIVGLAAVEDTLLATKVAVDRSKDVAHVVVTGVVLTEIHASEVRQEGGSSVDILLNSCHHDLLAVNGVASVEVDSVHGQLELPPEGKLSGTSFQEGVIQPLHKVTEQQVVEPASTNCPSSRGSSQGTGTCLENSLEERSCSSSELGWKQSKEPSI